MRKERTLEVRTWSPDGGSTVSSLAMYRQWMGKTVLFRKDSKEGGAIIDRGFQEGMILNARPTRDGDVLFEIAFGPAGSKMYCDMSQDGFIPPNGVSPSAKSGATKV
ncbi:MAG: hypothetical protein HY340_02775 [Candidatus Kerfeldbacteria bacterium]|nr:hypothetical protein [Candidatus Kerfeldbacteria bacterium]